MNVHGTEVTSTKQYGNDDLRDKGVAEKLNIIQLIVADQSRDVRADPKNEDQLLV